MRPEISPMLTRLWPPSGMITSAWRFDGSTNCMCIGRTVELPLYDFKNHARRAETLRMSPRPIIIIEGILVFTDERLRGEMDIKVFVDTPDDIRFIRRLRRDVAERGRTAESVIEQYLATVRPMHMQFVEPSKRYADVIIPEGGHNLVSIGLISGRIRERIADDRRRRREEAAAAVGLSIKAEQGG